MVDWECTWKVLTGPVKLATVLGYFTTVKFYHRFTAKQSPLQRQPPAYTSLPIAQPQHFSPTHSTVNTTHQQQHSRAIKRDTQPPLSPFWSHWRFPNVEKSKAALQFDNQTPMRKCSLASTIYSTIVLLLVLLH